MIALVSSSSSDSLSTVRVIHVILPITVTWRGVDEPTPKNLFFIQPKKKKMLEMNKNNHMITTIRALPT